MHFELVLKYWMELILYPSGIQFWRGGSSLNVGFKSKLHCAYSKESNASSERLSEMSDSTIHHN